MIPGINPKQMEKMMKQLGMKQQHIDARVVIIRLDDKELIIKNPEVLKVNMMGQETFQITGKIEEKELLDEGDVSLIQKESGCTREEAIKTLKENNGDIAASIIALKNE
ncbi:nascent polypeptide-associated complex protein [Candidatus Woesearchaeota archaeon]|nr:nascent polypeptide-associated complex protein [Candidatus Woesearchaeota archaeon]